MGFDGLSLSWAGREGRGTAGEGNGMGLEEAVQEVIRYPVAGGFVLVLALVQLVGGSLGHHPGSRRLPKDWPYWQ